MAVHIRCTYHISDYNVNVKRSTVGDADAPSFAAIANDIVVQELTLVGSRCVKIITTITLPWVK